MARTQNNNVAASSPVLTGAAKAAATRAANKAAALAQAEADALVAAQAEADAEAAAKRAATAATRKANREAKAALAAAAAPVATIDTAAFFPQAPAAAPAPAISVAAFFPQAPAAAPTTRTPEQQAALDAARDAKAKAAAAPEPQAAPQPAAAPIEDEVAAMVEALPSGKRVLVGFFLGLATSAAAGYGIGMLASYAIAGIVTLTSTAWIAIVLTVLTWMLALYSGWKIGGYVGGKVFSSVVMPDGLASRSAAAVGNLFSSGKDKIVDAYDSGKQQVGAFVKPVRTVAA